LKRALALVLVACVACASRAPARSTSESTAEVLPADVFIVRDWRAAYDKADGFDDPNRPETEKDARDILCRMDACTGAPPWIVKAHLFPFRFPATAIAPLADGRLAVIPLGLTGSGQCVDGRGDVTNTVSGRMDGDVVVLDEEVQPLAFVEEGRCEERGQAQHIRRRIDPHRARQSVQRSFRNLDQ